MNFIRRLFAPDHDQALDYDALLSDLITARQEIERLNFIIDERSKLFHELSRRLKECRAACPPDNDSTTVA